MERVENVASTGLERIYVPNSVPTRSSPVLPTFIGVPKMISLHAFCKQNKLAKSTVHRKAQELQIDTSKGLSLEDCDRLLEVFGIA